MNNIKYIHCFGTSYTAGGGFEWETNDLTRKKLLEKHYGYLNEEKTQYNFSWPGRLQKLIPNIQVLNHAKQGTGNDRMYRQIYDIVNDISFESEKHLFVLEFSNFGRIEDFSNKLNDFVVVNYKYNGKNMDYVNVTKSYFYNSKHENILINEFSDVFIPYFNLSFNERVQFKKLERNTSFFLHWLKSNNLNILISSSPDIFSKKDSALMNNFNCINYNKNLHKKNQFNLELFIQQWPIKIKNETGYNFDDFHAGFEGNNIISKIVYNKLLDMKIINGDYYDISDSYIKFETPNTKGNKTLL